MPKVSDPFVRHVVVPPYNGSDECDEWCTALHLVESMIAEWPVARLFDVDDFMIMIMGGWRRSGRPLLYLYKHGFTRYYLNIDADGEAWRYVPPKDIESDHPGRYTRLPSLEAAISALRSWEMPWMDPDRFGYLRDQDGLHAPHM